MSKPITRTKHFHSVLKRNGEDLKLIRDIEKNIRSIRPTVFQLPKAGVPVILLLSGGLDSIVAWDRLLGKYRLQVHPITAYKHPLEPQQRAIHFFSRYFRNKYPDLYQEPVPLRASFVDAKRHIQTLSKEALPEVILQQYITAGSYFQSPYSGTNAFTAVLGATHAQFLRLTQNLSVHTLIYGATADDGQFVHSQTYAFMRTLTRLLMMFVQDDKLQLGSVFYEEALGVHETKQQVLAAGHRRGLPLEKTYSCDKGGWWHCGSCPSCRARQHCFAANDIPDHTVYWNALLPARAIEKTKHILRSVSP